MRTHATTKVEISEGKTRVAKCPFNNLIVHSSFVFRVLSYSSKSNPILRNTALYSVSFLHFI